MTPTPTILIIDDDKDIRETFQMLLEINGYRVIMAPEGHAGLKKALQDRPQLVMVDMMMPRGSGFVVVEGIKSRDLCIPVIMITGHVNDQQRSYAEFLGVDAYLNKPVSPQQLMEEVRRLCPPPIGVTSRDYATNSHAAALSAF